MSALTKDATQVAKDVNKKDVNKDAQTMQNAQPTQPQRGKSAVEHAARLARDAEQNALERQHAKENPQQESVWICFLIRERLKRSAALTVET